VVLLEHGGDAAQHEDAFSSSGSATCTTWKRRVSAGSFSMCFLYSAQVVAPIVRSVPRASAGLSRLAASPVPAAPPAPTSVCASSMNRMIGFGLACTSSITWRRRCSNSPFMRAPACSRPMSSESSERPAAAAARRRAQAAARSLRRPRSCRPRPRREDRVVLAAAHQDVDDLADLVVAPGHGIHLALLGLGGEVDVYFLIASCLPIAAGAIAPDTSPGWPPDRPLPSCGRGPARRLADDATQVVGEVVDLELANSFEMASSALRRCGVFSIPSSR
jgi:hypothetical protein